MGRFAVAVRDGDRCSDNRSRLGLARLLDAGGSRRAVAVQDGCREISGRRPSHRQRPRERMRKITRWSSQGARQANQARL